MLDNLARDNLLAHAQAGDRAPELRARRGGARAGLSAAWRAERGGYWLSACRPNRPRRRPCKRTWREGPACASPACTPGAGVRQWPVVQRADTLRDGGVQLGDDLVARYRGRREPNQRAPLVAVDPDPV